jgi:hypothetical protein
MPEMPGFFPSDSFEPVNVNRIEDVCEISARGRRVVMLGALHQTIVGPHASDGVSPAIAADPTAD